VPESPSSDQSYQVTPGNEARNMTKGLVGRGRPGARGACAPPSITTGEVTVGRCCADMSIGRETGNERKETRKKCVFIEGICGFESY